jgi:hypothetical protein
MDMDRYYPYNSVGSDRLHDADDLARILKALISDGVAMVNAAALQVQAAGAFNVTVKAGTCVVQGRIGISDSDKTFTVPAPFAGLDRIDRIVARADYANRKTTLVYVQGSPASTPAAPTLKNDADGYDIPLARIAVSKSAASITQAAITDGRVLCGIVIPTGYEALFSQMQNAFTSWFAGIQSVLDSNTAGNLLNLINQYRAKKTTVSLPVSGWAASGDAYVQTMAVGIVPTNCVLHAGPEEESREAYSASDLHVSAATAGSVTFKAASVPETSITVNLAVSEVDA